jgi:hypothetical protein
MIHALWFFTLISYYFSVWYLGYGKCKSKLSDFLDANHPWLLDKCLTSKKKRKAEERRPKKRIKVC